jgi:hypothetical protein
LYEVEYCSVAAELGFGLFTLVAAGALVVPTGDGFSALELSSMPRALVGDAAAGGRVALFPRESTGMVMTRAMPTTPAAMPPISTHRGFFRSPASNSSDSSYSVRNI